jgi:hypothetical protein
MIFPSLSAPRFALLAALVGLLVPGIGSAETFRFDWPLQVPVGVVAAITGAGNTSTASYSVDLSADSDDELTLNFRDFQFLTLNGVDAREIEVTKKLGPLAALNQLPSMRLSKSGAYRGTFGIEQQIKGFLEQAPASRDDPQRKKLEGYFRSPEVQALVRQKSAETANIWNTWVGAWNGLELAPGQTVSAIVPITLMQREVRQSVLIEHLGTVGKNCPTCVHLRMTTVIDGPEVLALLGGLARSADDDASFGEFVSARSMSVTEVFTEAASLMPIYAMTNSEVLLRDEDDKTRTEQARKEYWFEWR